MLEAPISMFSETSIGPNATVSSDTQDLKSKAGLATIQYTCDAGTPTLSVKQRSGTAFPWTEVQSENLASNSGGIIDLNLVALPGLRLDLSGDGTNTSVVSMELVFGKP